MYMYEFPKTQSLYEQSLIIIQNNNNFTIQQINERFLWSALL